MQSIRSETIVAKTTCLFLFLVVLLCYLGSPAILPADKERTQPNQADLQINAEEEFTVDEWLKAKEARDYEKAVSIPAVQKQRANETWRHPGDDPVFAGHPQPGSPLRESNTHKAFIWGSDVIIAQGSVSHGISADYDESGNMYAARCSTYMDSSNALVKVYKSTDGGTSWFYLCGFFAPDGSYKFSYPVVLTGSVGGKLYVFHMTSQRNGDIKVARFTQAGAWEGLFDVKADMDSITYFSACTDMGLGSYLIVAYQREINRHRLYTIISTDYGETWDNLTAITDHGAHPDIAYGNDGYVYLVLERTEGEDSEIFFGRNTNYGITGFWQDFEFLTDDSCDDHYPKVAALHTLPEDTARVWVAYNHNRVERDTLKYDDDTVYYAWSIPNAYGDDLFNVRFTPSSGYSLKSAKFLFYRRTGTGGVRVYVWADTSGFPAQKIDSVDVPGAQIQPFPDWTIVDFSSKGTVLSNMTDFHIGYTALGPPATDTVFIISDNGVPPGAENRSSFFYGGNWHTTLDLWGYDVNFMIRAVMEQGVGMMDLRFAYSTNSGVDWVKDQIIAGELSYDEMACNLHVYRSPTWPYVDLCYLWWPIMIKAPKPDICYTWSQSSSPHLFHTPHETIVDDYPNWSPDGREVCQIVFPPALTEYPGIVYAGLLPLKKEESFFDGTWNLYFDHHDWTNIEDEMGEKESPMEFSLLDNYPNPFNPVTKISYSIPEACKVKLEIFNILGQKIRALVDEDQAVGKKTVSWDGRDEKGTSVASGVYFYKLKAGNFSQTNKMVLIR
jgi:hypothetical protein